MWLSPPLFSPVAAVVLWGGLLPPAASWADGEIPKSKVEAARELTASELIRKGREAFDRQDFAEAEKLLDQLIGDFGENPEVAAAADECRPMLAMCRVKRGAFEEAVEMIDASLKLPYQDNLSALIHDPSFKAVAGAAVFAKARLITTQAQLK